LDQWHEQTRAYYIGETALTYESGHFRLDYEGHAETRSGPLCSFFFAALFLMPLLAPASGSDNADDDARPEVTYSPRKGHARPKKG